jgi:hypothetical protein
MRGVEEQAAGKKRPSRVRINSPVDDGSQPMDVDAEEEEATNEKLIVLNHEKEIVVSTTGRDSHLDTDAPSRRYEEDVVSPGLVDRTGINLCSKDSRNTNANQEKSPKYNDPLIHKICNKTLRCAHGNLDPYKTEEIRYISKVGTPYAMGAEVKLD